MGLAEVIADKRFQAADPEDQARVLKQIGASDEFVNRYIGHFLTNPPAPREEQQATELEKTGNLPADMASRFQTGRFADVPEHKALGKGLAATSAIGTTGGILSTAGLAGLARFILGSMLGEEGGHLTTQAIGKLAAADPETLKQIDPYAQAAGGWIGGGTAMAKPQLLGNVTKLLPWGIGKRAVANFPRFFGVDAAPEPLSDMVRSSGATRANGPARPIEPEGPPTTPPPASGTRTATGNNDLASELRKANYSEETIQRILAANSPEGRTAALSAQASSGPDPLVKAKAAAELRKLDTSPQARALLPTDPGTEVVDTSSAAARAELARQELARSISQSSSAGAPAARSQQTIQQLSDAINATLPSQAPPTPLSSTLMKAQAPGATSLEELIKEMGHYPGGGF